MEHETVILDDFSRSADYRMFTHRRTGGGRSRQRHLRRKSDLDAGQRGRADHLRHGRDEKLFR